MQRSLPDHHRLQGTGAKLDLAACSCGLTSVRAKLTPRLCKQVAETATQFFISADRPNVAGMVLAGSADFKTELSQSDMFDARLQGIVLSVVDVSYGVPLCQACLHKCSSKAVNGLHVLAQPVFISCFGKLHDTSRRECAPLVAHLSS